MFINKCQNYFKEFHETIFKSFSLSDPDPWHSSRSDCIRAAEWPSDISISADGGILMDINSGAVLYEKNSHEPYYPASITKILTALIVIENCSLDETVTFSNTAVNTLEPNSSILGARAGDTLSVRDCLYALLLQSANEVANALAEHCAGSMDAFAEMMNERVAELGCTDSHLRIRADSTIRTTMYPPTIWLSSQKRRLTIRRSWRSIPPHIMMYLPEN